MPDIDTAAPNEILSRAAELLASDANEAETRLKIIDRILFGVLEWTHDDVRVEERATEDGSTKFVDYVCSTALASLVIEAKRIGISYDDLPDPRRVNLGRLLSTSAGEAILQARDYGSASAEGPVCRTIFADYYPWPGVLRCGLYPDEAGRVRRTASPV